MIYIEKNDTPYVCVDSKESLDFLINATKMHVGIDNFDLDDLVQYGVLVFTNQELSSVIHVFEINGVSFVNSKDGSGAESFVAEVEKYFKTEVYIPTESEL